MRISKISIIYFAVIFIDQLSKYYWLDHSVLNSGLAFGTLSNQKNLIVTLYITAGTCLIYLFIKSSKKTSQELFFWATIFGGITGNLIDRIRVGQIIDPFQPVLDFPAFNIADVAIIVGALGLILQQIKKK